MRMRQYAYFSISSQTMSADQMATRIGLVPDKTTIRGSKRADAIIVPAEHSWCIYAAEQARPVDEQISALLARLRPYQEAIAALVGGEGSASRGQLHVVRHFNDPEGEVESLDSRASGLEKLPGQHQLLGWHLSHDVMAFLMSVAAELDVDEYDLQP